MALPACSPPGRSAVVVPPSGTDVAITEANASCTIKYTGRAWCTASNDVWNGTSYTRYNRSRVIDLATWSAGVVSFEAIALPGLTSTPCDPYVCVVVDGVLSDVVYIPTSYYPRRYTVSVPSGTHDVQLWDGWQARVTQFGTGSDGRISGCYVTSVRVPSGQPSPVKLTAARGVVSFGDSTNDATSNAPYSWYGWTAQLRRRLHAVGGLLGYLGWGAGTLAGDGITAAQLATCISDLWAAMGSTQKQFIYVARPNDYKYYALGADIDPTEFTTYMAAVLDALTVSDAGYTAIIAAPSFAQGSNEVGANSGGFTRADYYTALAGVTTGRSQVSIVDLSATLSAATGLAEGAVNGVHPNQLGNDLLATRLITAVGGL